MTFERSGGGKMDKREIKKVLWIVLIVLFIVGALNGERWYWTYWDFKPLTIHGKIKIKNPGSIVCAGSLMIYEVCFDKTMDVACTIKKQMVNSYLISYDPEEPPRKPLGSYQKATGSAHIPGRTDPGEWFMRWTAECPTGPYGRVIFVNAVSDKFQVIDCEGHSRGWKIGGGGK
jgi:hypothetical protein